MLGVDAGDFARFKRWSDPRSQIFNTARTPEQSTELAAAKQGLDDYFAHAVEERRHRRGTDLVSALVSAEESGDRLTQREIVVTCNLLMVAGNLTTTDLIGNGILALLFYPDQLVKLRAHPELVPHAVEEILRYDPPVAQTSRIALDPLEIGGERGTGGRGDEVSILAAGGDPARHSEPHRFDSSGATPAISPLAEERISAWGRRLPAPRRRSPFPRCSSASPASVSIRSIRSTEGAPVFNGLTALRVRSA